MCPRIPTAIGYHGTTKEVAGSILRHGFTPSDNPYDWLGEGVYFFQDAPKRAWDWARMKFSSDAAVVGASIRLEGCMDLVDIGWEPIILDLYVKFKQSYKKAGLVPPLQRGGRHELDNTVLNYAIDLLNEAGPPIRVVRGVFLEGQPIFERSALYDRAHIQIAVRDTSLIEEIWMESETSA